MLVKAAIKKLDGLRHEAAAIIHLYKNKSVGIGEHPGVIDEIIKAAGAYAEADDKLTVLCAISGFPKPQLDLNEKS